MAKGTSYITGSDAAYIKPKLVPDQQLLARDDSGGPDFTPRTAVFGDGYDKIGTKPHLSTGEGKQDPFSGSERSRSPREKM